MPEENPNPSPMNLDLNLGPLDNSIDNGDSGSRSNPNTAINLTDWLEAPVHRVRPVVRNRTRRLSSWSRQLPLPSQTRPSDHLSIAPEGTTKTCQKNPNTCTEDDNVQGKKDNLGKKNTQENTFFDCNICLDLAKDPVVTCCGHLFCWPCLYHWLHHHSSARECPVCKGDVDTKNVVPIYGRGDPTHDPPNMDPILPVPIRPQAQRVESWRRTVERNALAVPMEEMITRLGTTFDLQQGLAQREQYQNSDRDRATDEINSLLRDRILTSRGMRGDRPTLGGPSDDVDFLRDIEFVSAGERFVETDMHTRSIEFSPPVDDRDSLSSIAAVIQSESQTVDNNVIEIDSTVARSTVSSGRRNDASRISDVDSEDSRVPRRRRL